MARDPAFPATVNNARSIDNSGRGRLRVVAALAVITSALMFTAALAAPVPGVRGRRRNGKPGYC